MYFIAELVFKSYHVYSLEPGMIFMELVYPGTDDQQVRAFVLDKVPNDEELFLKEHGYPVEFYILATDHRESFTEILAYPEQIGWFDEGDNTDELYEVDVDIINDILNYYDGIVGIDVDGETGEPTIYEGKVIITYPEEDEGPDYDGAGYSEEDRIVNGQYTNDEDLQWDYMNGEYPEQD